ncbi:hypothetical protein [Streptomyces sp. NPDC001743]|uniref:hypothetical protein n=1 Tax=Streptomyces sp. NPDC001743 TaxID=3154397 RepID=UPI00331FB2B3
MSSLASPEDLEHRIRMATGNLARALRDAGWSATPDYEATTVTVLVLSPGDPWDEGPAADPAIPLRTFLQRHGVNAIVHAHGSGGLRLTTADVASADHLADIVARSMSAPYRAALMLKTALAHADMAPPLEATVAGERVEIGDLDLKAVLRLRGLLGNHPEPRFDADRATWHTVEEIAALMRPLLARVCGEPVPVEAAPACKSCRMAREHQISFGPVSPHGAERLAKAIDTSLAESAPIAGSGMGGLHPVERGDRP